MYSYDSLLPSDPLNCNTKLTNIITASYTLPLKLAMGRKLFTLQKEGFRAMLT